MFNPIADMNAIDGIIADLASKTDRPQGYPFSKVTVYSVCPEVAAFMPEFHHQSASNVPSMRKLDFKKAGKAFPDKVKEWKSDLSKAPEEFVITADRFNQIDEPTRKTTGCRKFLVEVENEDQEDRWLVVQFRKSIKKYITEDMAIHIVPPIFGDKYPELNIPCVTHVVVTLGNCSERLYQAITRIDSMFEYPYDTMRRSYGEQEFAEYPIRLNVPSRQYICDHMGEHLVAFGAETVRFDVTP